MTMLQMLEVTPRLPALVRFARLQGLGSADQDLGYAVHAWMEGAFGDLSPSIWRLLMDRRRPSRILAYGCYDAEEMIQRLREFGDPAVIAVVDNPAENVRSRPIPEWQEGRHLGFEVFCCPIGRQSQTGREKDLFLMHADHETPCTLDRSTVYGEWLARQFRERGGATVDGVRLESFRLSRLLRQTHGETGKREPHALIRPQALMRGNVVVGSPQQFQHLLMHGVGRHRAFGYGMVLLRPPW